MVEKEIRKKLESILLTNFEVNPLLFDWNVPLADLQQKFGLLGYLVFFEQLINESFEGKFHILENINAAIHTPNDVYQLIQKELITNL